jgi:hypothetical protein
MLTVNDIQVGSVIIVRGDFGKGAAVRATVTELDVDVDTNVVSFSYISLGEPEKWAYLHQIDSVEKY